MTDNSPRLGLSYLVAAQAQKEVTHNDALNDLDVLVQPVVASRTLNVAPAAPAEGDVYIVGAAPTGLWAGQAGKVAAYYAGWRFKTPKVGWGAFVVAEGRFCFFDGAAWVLGASLGYEGSLVWSPGALAAGTGATSAVVAFAGAALGDFVLVSAPYDLQGVQASAYVSAAGSVRIRLGNMTGASVSLGSGTWRVRVLKG